jgi:hypothetical protein
MKVNDIVKYVGEESDEIPFKKGDLVLLKREEADGYAAVPFDKPKSKEATLVYVAEVEEIDEDEVEEAREEADAAKDIDEAEAEEERQRLEEAERKAAAEEKKSKTKEKKVTTPAPDAEVRKVQKESTAKTVEKVEAPDFVELGKLADNGDEAAAEKMNIVSAELELDPNDFKTWALLGKRITKLKSEVTTEVTKTKSSKNEEKEEVEELVLTKEIVEAMKGKGAIRAARDLVAAGTIADFTLGGILAKIAADKDFEKEIDPETGEKFSGHKGFEAFIERDLGIRYRKAQWLIEFYVTFSKAGVDTKKLGKAKYSKVKEVLAIVRAKPLEAEQWLDKAIDSKFEDLTVEARRYERKIGIEKKARGTNEATMVNYKFKLFNKQAKNVDEAIAKAKTLIEFEKTDDEAMQNAKAIYHIFSEWLQLQG